MFDVDSKDLTVGMSCPPPAFVEKPFLQKVKTILKAEGRRGDPAGPSSRWVPDPGVSVGVVTAGSSVEWVAFGAAGSGRLRHPQEGGQERLREGRGCRRYLGTDCVAAHDPPGSRDMELGQGHQRGGMLVLLVLLWGRCFHPGGTDSAAFPRGRQEAG